MPPHPKLHLFLEVGVESHRSFGVRNTHFLASLNEGKIYDSSLCSFHIMHFNDAEPTEQRLCQYKSYKGEKILSHKNMFHFI